MSLSLSRLYRALVHVTDSFIFSPGLVFSDFHLVLFLGFYTSPLLCPRGERFINNLDTCLFYFVQSFAIHYFVALAPGILLGLFFLTGNAYQREHPNWLDFR